MDDGDPVLAASELLSQLGHGSVDELREKAKAALAAGDRLSAETWTDIADAAEAVIAGAGRTRADNRSNTSGRG